MKDILAWIQQVWQKFCKTLTEVKPIQIVANADYTYILPKTNVKTDSSGDSYAMCTFKVMHLGDELGTMTIWHNHTGANAHFNETRSYPLS
jgi:hypothetical protein